MARLRRASALLALSLAAASLEACARAAGVAVPAAPATRLAGNIQDIDLAASRVTLMDAGRLRTVDLIPTTVIRHGRTEKTIQDLRRGDRVVVSMAATPPYGARLVAVAGPVDTASPRPPLGVPPP
jgi:Cu/Ag efflux protein CusF